jgi:hypothetical protein
MLGIGFLCLIIVAMQSAPIEQKTDAVPNSQAKAPVASKSTQASNSIPGVQPVDIYLNLTNKGFVKTGPTKTDDKITYRVEDREHQMSVFIYGPSVSEVESVQATIWGVENMGQPAAEFFGYIATLPYDGANPQIASDWVKANINNNATSTYGGVRFTINANGPAARILRIEKSK